MSNHDFATTAAIAQFKDLAFQAMLAAHEEVLAERAKDVSQLERGHAAQIENAPTRSSEHIASLLKRIGAITNMRLKDPNPSDGFDCQANVMLVNSLESPQDPGNPASRSEDVLEEPDPNQLRYAARLVWDFCKAAGYHLELVRGARRMNSFSPQRCFCIRIYWNIPAQLKAA